MPIFEYDHIVDFAEAPRHEAANLALLCPNHHRDKTAGRLSRETVAEARLRPFNLSRDITSTYGLSIVNPLQIWLGSNHALGTIGKGEYYVIWINGLPFLTIHYEDNNYTYSAQLTDRVGKTLLKIDHGALAVVTDEWDYYYEGRILSIRRGHGDILLEAEISDRAFSIYRGTFVDKFETGVEVKRDGSIAWLMSGLEFGTNGAGRWGVNATGVFAVARRSVFGGEIPRGFGFVRQWVAEYEQRAADLRSRMESGEPGHYPPGLEQFRPYSRNR
jgi:hypothetical protein